MTAARPSEHVVRKARSTLSGEPERLPPAVLRAAVVTVSDRCARGETPDDSGGFLVHALRQAGFDADDAVVVPDEAGEITGALLRLADEERVALILTTGGTGFSPRDVTPEATRPLLERDSPGIAEALRADALRKTAHAMLSRGVAGLRGGTLIVNLPGGLQAVRDGMGLLAPVLPHALRLLGGATQAAEEHAAPPLAVVSGAGSPPPVGGPPPRQDP